MSTTDRRFALVEKFFRKQKFQEDLRRYALIKPKVWNPDITISRDPGSGGKIIARDVAKKLGWKLYDKEILKQTAQKLGFDEHIVRSVEEHPRGKLTDIFQALFNPSYISDYTYLKVLKKLIRKAGRAEDVVFLGRGANHIIPSALALHVRITATFERRVENTVKFEGMTQDQARRHVAKVQDNRNAFIKQYFGCDPNCPDYFDLIINTDNISNAAAAKVIIAAFKLKFPRRKV